MVDFKKKLEIKKKKVLGTIPNSASQFMRIKQNRLRVFKILWDLFGDQRMCSMEESTLEGLRYAIWQRNHENNPSRGCELLKLYHSLTPIDISYNALVELHEVYWPRFIKYATKKVLKAGDGQKGPWPTMNRTKAIGEFIARGFVYETDAKIDRINKYCVKANIANLWWPRDFETHQDAIDIQSRFGISGLTGTTLPKPK